MSAATFDPSKCVPAHLVLSPDERADIEACIESLMAILDASEGDVDLEDGTDLEDDFALSPHALAFGLGRGPGCTISDAAEDGDSDCCTDDLDELDRRVSPVAPVYGIDQTAAPLNMRAMEAAQYRAEQRRAA
ncbi:hypothetical protein GCM10007897_41540 [Sphingobium jiangsuense]|nr:hypothetical protein GCM10007897_41540 [Sphingobium jiangsuense]